MNSDIYPILAMALVVFLAAVVITSSLAFRYKNREMVHQEHLAALEKGLPVAAELPSNQRPVWRSYLLRGLVWLFTGVSLTIFMLAAALTTRHDTPAWVRVDQATHARDNGATEQQIRDIMNDRRTDGPPPALCLIGLIPAGVGLAYLITYRAERRSAN